MATAHGAFGLSIISSTDGPAGWFPQVGITSTGLACSSGRPTGFESAVLRACLSRCPGGAPPSLRRLPRSLPAQGAGSAGPNGTARLLSGMPPALDPRDVYAADTADRP